jgi:hypothetical protein
LAPLLGNRQRNYALKADDACGQVDLPEPPIADVDVAAYVHVRPGDRAFALRMPAAGDEIAALVLDRVVVADDLDAPAVRFLSNLVVLANAEAERMPSAELRQIREFDAMGTDPAYVAVALIYARIELLRGQR